MKRIGLLIIVMVVTFIVHGQPCSEGYYDNEGTCTQCPPGRYCPDGENSYLCDPGRYQDQPGQTACLPCNPGYFQSSEGATSCDVCSPGRFSSEPESTECTPCAEGFFADGTGSVSCDACPDFMTSEEEAVSCYCESVMLDGPESFCLDDLQGEGFSDWGVSPEGGVFSGEDITPEGVFTPSSPGEYTISYAYDDPGSGCADSGEEMFPVEICTHLYEGTKSTIATVYPNPVSSELYIVYKGDGLTKGVLYNSRGAMVCSKVLYPGENAVDLRGHAPGLYLIFIHHEGRRHLYKVSKF